MENKGQVRVGIAGWVFEPWRGSFYPVGLRAKDELAYASSVLGVIEINATYYRTQAASSFTAWAAAVPENFMFSVKGNRFITQGLKSRDPSAALANFFASGLFNLGPKLGPIVWQLPDHLQFDPGPFESFLALLPQSPAEAQALAAKHEERVSDPVIKPHGVKAFRHALETSHKSFASEEALALLRKHNVALVIQDTAEWPLLDLTADFVYARLKGPPSGTGYGEAELDLWAERIKSWAEGQGTDNAAPRDVFAFFVHEDKLHAPDNAQALMERLGLTSAASAP